MEPTIGHIVIYHNDPMVTRNAMSLDLPAFVVDVCDATKRVNLKVMNDGPTDCWLQNVSQGTKTGQWSWPDFNQR